MADRVLTNARLAPFAQNEGQEQFPVSQSEAMVGVMDFETFVRAEHSKLVWFLMSQGADPHEASDATQSAFLDAWQQGWDTITNPRAWVRKVASRKLWRSAPAQRSPGHIDTLVSDVPERQTADTAFGEVELDEQELWVASVLAELPPRQRQVMALRYDGYSTQEIADYLGVEASAVRHNTARAKSRLGYLRARAQEAAG